MNQSALDKLPTGPLSVKSGKKIILKKLDNNIRYGRDAASKPGSMAGGLITGVSFRNKNLGKEEVKSVITALTKADTIEEENTKD